MQTYLVGGAVRDRLLGLPVRERDWVVVGARAGDLEALGYQRVGRSFPVFLHPETKEEHAMARTETKTGPGYRGFEVRADETVTLKEDLGRRDLTINAIAEDTDGRLIDPFDGQHDIDARVLRHVTDAFREDPVRILRVARFAARFAEIGFSVADDTLELMRAMVADGEADALIAERVWKETQRALDETRPDVFIEVLREVGALRVIYPEIDALFGVPQTERWHPEIDTGVHVLMTLRVAAELNATPEARFALLVHDLGKGTTPAQLLPSHIGHEERGVGLIETLYDRVGVPNRYRRLAILVARYHGVCHRAAELRPKTILKVLEALDAFRNPAALDDFLIACEADARGRLGLESRPYPQANLFRNALTAAVAISADDVARDGLTGPAIGAAIRRARVAAIKAQRE
ncbi:MAG: multifunctional CCA addition/repair protein [Gammaproteobacteria bacterium]|nr:multifunctional CCA addition/repair protein [Gammaproteobacteria bacterium]